MDSGSSTQIAQNGANPNVGAGEGTPEHYLLSKRDEAERGRLVYLFVFSR